MLNSIQSMQTHRFGVADVDENKIIIPINYINITFNKFGIIANNIDGTSDAYLFDGTPLIKNGRNIIFQKYGFTSENTDGTSNAYLYDGTPLVGNSQNILFLDNNLMLVSDMKKQMCFILDYKKNNIVAKVKFEAILFFCGSNKQAQMYSPTTNINQIFSNPDYQQFGAHLESLVCGKVHNLWGVYDIEAGRIHADFNYLLMVHCRGKAIAARCNDGTMAML